LGVGESQAGGTGEEKAEKGTVSFRGRLLGGSLVNENVSDGEEGAIRIVGRRDEKGNGGKRRRTTS